jgi:hypothetical protein
MRKCHINKVLSQVINFSFRTAAKLAEALKMDFKPMLIPSSEELREDIAKVNKGLQP